MRIRYGILLFAAFIVLSFTMVVLAQDSTCPALVQQALSDVGDNCSDLSRNAACYGFRAGIKKTMPANHVVKRTTVGDNVTFKSPFVS